MDHLRDQVRKAEGELDMLRRERDRLKGQLSENKTHISLLTQQIEDFEAALYSAKTQVCACI